MQSLTDRDTEVAGRAAGAQLGELCVALMAPVLCRVVPVAAVLVRVPRRFVHGLSFLRPSLSRSLSRHRARHPSITRPTTARTCNCAVVKLSILPFHPLVVVSFCMHTSHTLTFQRAVEAVAGPDSNQAVFGGLLSELQAKAAGPLADAAACAIFARLLAGLANGAAAVEPLAAISRQLLAGPDQLFGEHVRVLQAILSSACGSAVLSALGGAAPVWDLLAPRLVRPIGTAAVDAAPSALHESAGVGSGGESGPPTATGAASSASAATEATAAQPVAGVSLDGAAGETLAEVAVTLVMSVAAGDSR